MQVLLRKHKSRMCPSRHLWTALPVCVQREASVFDEHCSSRCVCHRDLSLRRSKSCKFLRPSDSSQCGVRIPPASRILASAASESHQSHPCFRLPTGASHSNPTVLSPVIFVCFVTSFCVHSNTILFYSHPCPVFPHCCSAQPFWPPSAILARSAR